MIVWLMSYPRSGNTLLRTLIYHLTGNITYSIPGDREFIREGFADQVGHKLLGIRGRRFFTHEGNPHPKIQKMLRSSKVWAIKSHARHRGRPFDAPTIYIVRDGRDAEISLAHYATWKHTTGGVSAEQHLFNRITKDGNWGDHVEGWLPHADVVVKYEDMLEAPIEELQRIITTLQLLWEINPKAKVPSFRKLHKICPEFFRKGKAGAWKKELSPALNEVFIARFGDTLRKLGYLQGD